jgi:hypothetical protein
MRKITMCALGLVAIALTYGCAGTYTLEHSKVLNETNLSLYKTFSIAPYAQAKHVKQKGQAPLSELDYNNLANAIRTQMVSRGYNEESASNLVINFGLFTERNADITTNLYPDYFYGRMGMYSPYAYRPYRGYTSTRIYKEGIWVVDFIDVQRKMHVFSAAVSAEMSPKKLSLKDMSEIQEAGRVLFKKFPVKPLKAMK